jgi:hypothetical protein
MDAEENENVVSSDRSTPTTPATTAGAAAVLAGPLQVAQTPAVAGKQDNEDSFAGRADAPVVRTELPWNASTTAVGWNQGLGCPSLGRTDASTVCDEPPPIASKTAEIWLAIWKIHFLQAALQQDVWNHKKPRLRPRRVLLDLIRCIRCSMRWVCFRMSEIELFLSLISCLQHPHCHPYRSGAHCLFQCLS